MPPKAKQEASKSIDISIVTVRCKIKGIRPLLMQNGEMVDQTTPLAIERKKITSKTTRARDGVATEEQLAKLDFQGCVYRDADGDICVPGENIAAAISDGGKIRKKGKALYGAVRCFEDAKLNYLGRNEIKKFDDLLENYKRFSLRKRTKLAGPGGKSVMRTRPMFCDWSLSFDLLVTLGVDVDLDDVQSALEICGHTIGLGDWHGRYGLFVIEKFEQVKK